MYASATVDMWLSLVLCSASCVVLHLWGDNNKLGLQIGESQPISAGVLSVIIPLKYYMIIVKCESNPLQTCFTYNTYNHHHLHHLHDLNHKDHHRDHHDLSELVFIGVGLQGAGTAAVFSTTFLWLETLMPVTNAIGAAYTVAWNVAVQVLLYFIRL